MVQEVSQRALIARINRRLKHSDQQLKKARVIHDGPRVVPNCDLGWYYVLDVNRNWIIETYVDPSELAERLGVLYENEQVASD